LYSVTCYAVNILPGHNASSCYAGDDLEIRRAAANILNKARTADNGWSFRDLMCSEGRNDYSDSEFEFYISNLFSNLLFLS